MSTSSCTNCTLIGPLLFAGAYVGFEVLQQFLLSKHNAMKFIKTISFERQAEYKHPRNGYVLSKPIRVRFPESAKGWDEAVTYFRNRATQGLADGVCLLNVVPVDNWGALATFSIEPVDSRSVSNEEVSDRIYYSLYVFDAHRGQGHYSQWLKENPEKIILTTSDCKLADLLFRCGHPYRLADPSALQWVEYQLTQQFYGDHCAARTGLHFMNHVDEGLFVMRCISSNTKSDRDENSGNGGGDGDGSSRCARMRCSDVAMRAYVLHPLVQGDNEYAELLARLANKSNTADPVHQIDPLVIALAVEYRHIANGYLSHHHAAYFEGTNTNGVTDGVRLSPSQEVNDMLVADKVQNRKDFDLKHVNSHAKAALLSSYFDAWQRKLGVSGAKYKEVQYQLLRRVFGIAEGFEERAMAAVEQYCSGNENER